MRSVWLLFTFFLLRQTLTFSLEPFGFVCPVLVAEPRTHVGTVVPGYYLVPTLAIHF